MENATPGSAALIDEEVIADAGMTKATGEVAGNLTDLGAERQISDAYETGSAMPTVDEAVGVMPVAPEDLRHFLPNNIAFPGHLHLIDGSYGSALEAAPAFKAWNAQLNDANTFFRSALRR